jgi:rod shape-determining protein MreD
VHDAAVPTARRREGSFRERSLRPPRIDRRHMGLLFAAIGATVAALLEASLVPYIAWGDAAPHPVLLGGVIWTIAAGIDRGVTWAFVGGLVLDSLLGRPLGGTAFALLVAVGGAAVVARPFPRLRLVAPVVAVPILSLVYTMVLVGVTAGLQPGVAYPGVAAFLPDALYDAIIGMFVGPLAVTLRDRRAAATERVEW